MNKRLKAKWVKALRSGKYNQTAGWLVDLQADGSKSFCCLGVLREIAPTIQQHSEGEEVLDPASCGITSEVQAELAKHNDNGKSFKWIASNIERRKSL